MTGNGKQGEQAGRGGRGGTEEEREGPVLVVLVVLVGGYADQDDPPRCYLLTSMLVCCMHNGEWFSYMNNFL